MDQRTLRKFFHHRPAVIGLLGLIVIIGLSVAAPVIAPYEPWSTNLERTLEGPSLDFFFGTDELGRCVFSRVLYGGRLSIWVGVVAVAIGVLFGGILGVIGGYFGGKVESLIMRTVDVFLAFPSILLAIVIAAMLGPGLLNVILAVGIRNVPSFARIIHSKVLSVKKSDYVTAARSVGASDIRIMFRSVLPNVFSTLLVFSTLQIANSILLGGVLNFIGLGIQAPVAEWGKMVSDGRSWLASAPHISTFPGLAILFVAMGFNLIGDGLRDSLDPRFSS